MIGLACASAQESLPPPTLPISPCTSLCQPLHTGVLPIRAHHTPLPPLYKHRARLFSKHKGEEASASQQQQAAFPA